MSRCAHCANTVPHCHLGVPMTMEPGARAEALAKEQEIAFDAWLDENRDVLPSLLLAFRGGWFAALARAAQEPDGKLLTCPWCGEDQRGRIANAQISHLIECGDRARAAQGAPIGDDARQAES